MRKLDWREVPWTIGDMLRAFALVVLGLFLAAVAIERLSGLSQAGDQVARLVLAAMIQAALMIGAVLVVALGVRRASWRHLGLDRPLSRFWSGLLGGVAMVVAALAFGWLVRHVSPELPTQPMVDIMLEHSGWRSAAALGFVVVVLAPLSEELVFRGFIYAGLRRWLGKWPAVMLASLAFTLVHLQFHWALFFQIMLLGIILALLYERTRNLLVPILAHGVYNFAIAALLLLGGG